MWETDGFKGEKGTNRDMETNRNMKWRREKIHEKRQREIDFTVIIISMTTVKSEIENMTGTIFTIFFFTVMRSLKLHVQ